MFHAGVKPESPKTQIGNSRKSLMAGNLSGAAHQAFLPTLICKRDVLDPYLRTPACARAWRRVHVEARACGGACMWGRERVGVHARACGCGLGWISLHLCCVRPVYDRAVCRFLRDSSREKQRKENSRGSTLEAQSLPKKDSFAGCMWVTGSAPSAPTASAAEVQYTTSPSWPCAKSEMPMVALFPSPRMARLRKDSNC